MSDLPFASEQLARATEGYLAARYRAMDLMQLCSARLMQGDDASLARALYNWRDAADWSEPHIIGETRCAACHVLMGDEPSACEDEEICAKCGPSADEQDTLDASEDDPA